MPAKVLISAGGVELEAEFNDSATAAAILEMLPVTVEMSRWGDEYYGDLGEALGQGVAADARTRMSVGEIAYWPTGNAICIFFGPTPASSGDEPVAASSVNPVGRLKGDPAALRPLGGSVEMVFGRA